VAADESGEELEKVPFGAGRAQHFERIDAELMEDDRQFVHQGDIDVALGIFDNLGGFGDLDRRGAMHSGLDNRLINFRHGLKRLGIAARNDLGYGLQPMHLIAGVDAFGAVSDSEIFQIFEPGILFEQRHAFIFGNTRIDGRFSV